MSSLPTSQAHWRDTARSAKFFFIDAAASIPMLLFLLHIKVWTFVVASTTMLFFTLLARFGFSVKIFIRIFRSILAGPRKMAIPWWTN